MKKSELCYAIWSWGGSKEELELAAQEISAIGYRKFETTERAMYAYDFNANEYKSMLDRYSLTAESFYFFMPEAGKEAALFDVLEREFEFLAKIGVQNATLQAVFGRPQNGIMDEASEQHNLNVIRKFSNIAKSFGLKTSIHPHVNTYCMYEDEIDFVMQNLSADEVGLAPDTAHMAATGADPMKIMEKYADRITFTHLKDYKFSEETPLKSWVGSDFHVSKCFYEIGSGALDFPKIMKILESVHYDGPLCIELDRSRTSNEESAKKSFDYLSKFLEG